MSISLYQAEVQSEILSYYRLAAFTRLSRRVSRPGVLRPGFQPCRYPGARLNGLISRALAVILKLLIESTLTLSLFSSTQR